MPAGPPSDKPGDVRQRTRCPICDGPTYQAASGRSRCRNSLCVFNHKDAACPRCKGRSLKSAWFADGSYHYSCAGCQNSWATPA